MENKNTKKLISLRVSRETDRQIETLAAAWGETRTEVIARSIERQFRNEKGIEMGITQEQKAKLNREATEQLCNHLEEKHGEGWRHSFLVAWDSNKKRFKIVPCGLIEGDVCETAEYFVSGLTFEEIAVQAFTDDELADLDNAEGQQVYS